MFASKAPSSSVPLPLRVRRMGLAMERGPPEFPWVLNGISRAELCRTEPAVAEETQGVELSRCARGDRMFASKAPSGSVPLPLRVR